MICCYIELFYQTKSSAQVETIPKTPYYIHYHICLVKHIFLLSKVSKVFILLHFPSNYSENLPACSFHNYCQNDLKNTQNDFNQFSNLQYYDKNNLDAICPLEFLLTIIMVLIPSKIRVSNTLRKWPLKETTVKFFCCKWIYFVTLINLQPFLLFCNYCIKNWLMARWGLFSVKKFCGVT